MEQQMQEMYNKLRGMIGWILRAEEQPCLKPLCQSCLTSLHKHPISILGDCEGSVRTLLICLQAQRDGWPRVKPGSLREARQLRVECQQFIASWKWETQDRVFCKMHLEEMGVFCPGQQPGAQSAKGLEVL